MHLQGLQTDCLYNYLDRLEKESLYSDGSSPTITYQYDDNGSLTSESVAGGDTTTYVYNLQNRLRQLKVNGVETVNYYYNPDGIRVGKENIGGTTTDYLIDPYNHTGYSQVLKENPSSGSDIAYIIGNDVLGQVTGTSNPIYMLYDGHGSVRQLVDNAGNPVTGQNFNFDAYGNLINAATPQTNLLYTGEYYDTSLNMYNLRARYYNPLTGRFNAIDPFEGFNSDPISLHKYLYCHSNPINGTDASGMELNLMTTTTSVGTSEKLQAEDIWVTLSVSDKVAYVMLAALAGGALYDLSCDIDETLERINVKQEINKLIEKKKASVTNLTQNEFNELEESIRIKTKTRNRDRKFIYLHYSFDYHAESLLLGLAQAGVYNPEGTYATRKVYLTGWYAKWELALSGLPRNAVYIVYPRRGYEPTSEGEVLPNNGMGGGGYQYIFGKGSGGPGTVFPPIPIPEGTNLWN